MFLGEMYIPFAEMPNLRNIALTGDEYDDTAYLALTQGEGSIPQSNRPVGNEAPVNFGGGPKSGFKPVYDWKNPSQQNLFIDIFVYFVQVVWKADTVWLVELFTLVQIYVFFIYLSIYTLLMMLWWKCIFADSDRRRLHVVVII